MPLLKWTGAYSVGVPAMDAQHQRLITLINEFHQAMSEGHGSQQVRAVLDALADYTVKHFRDEEALMERHHYPALAEHRRKHQELIRSVEELRQKNKDSEIGLSITVSDFLKEWLTNHIQGADKKYGPYLQEKKAA